MKKLTLFATGMIACFIFVLATSTPIFAQVGIFGGVPNPVLYPTGNLNYVRRVRVKGTNTLGQGVSISYPLNGILNYVAYFDPLNGGTTNEYFLFEGTYNLQYLDASGSLVIPIGLSSSSDGPFNYVPNAGFTNGFQVRPPNSGASGALGIQGFVLDSSGNGIFNAIVKIGSMRWS